MTPVDCSLGAFNVDFDRRPARLIGRCLLYHGGVPRYRTMT
jgi:hypothetical protein